MMDQLIKEKLEINIRPIRFVYFYKKGDKAALEEIFKYVNTQWGGIFNLIIPVSIKGNISPFYEELLLKNIPDLFVSTLPSEINKFLNKKLSAKFPYRKVDLLIFEYFKEQDNSAHPLSMISKKEGSIQSLLLPKIDKPEENRLLKLALFGEIYSNQIEHYNQYLAVQNYSNIETPNHIIDAQFWILPSYSAINLTSINVRTLSKSGGGAIFADSDIFDIVVGSDEADLVLYWNYRAIREACQANKSYEFGRRVLLMPTSFINKKQKLLAFFKAIKEDRIWGNSNLDICISGSKQNIKKISENLINIDFLKEFTEKKITFKFSRTSNREKEFLTYTFNTPLWLGSRFRQNIGSSTILMQDFANGANDIFYTPPKEFNNHFGQVIAIDLKSDLWKSFPQNNIVSNKIRDGSFFNESILTTLSVVKNIQSLINIYIPDDWTKLKLFFEEKGYVIKPSKLTQYANSVIDLIGGIKNLDIFRSNEVIKLLEILSLKSSHKVAQKISKQLNLVKIKEDEILKVFYDLEIAPELKGIPKSFTELKGDERFKENRDKLLEILNKLSQFQIIKRGFYLECSKCGTYEWYPLGEANENLICPGCSNKFLMPVKENNDEIKWRFRLNSLINRCVDQDLFVSLIAVAKLIKNKKSYSHYFGLEIYKQDKLLTDIDLIFISDQKIIVGECKRSDSFSKKDFKNSRLLTDIGCHEFYFCSLDEIGQTNLNKIEILKKYLIRKESTSQLFSISAKEIFTS